MVSLNAALSGLSSNEKRDIFALGRYIENHIEQTWQVILETQRDKLLDAFSKVGDPAYGTYYNLLYRPVHKQLKESGLRASPRLPGNFNSSREWGNADESDNQRWSWSTIKSAEGEPLGTIVTKMFHDHTQFRIPHRPEIIALRETSKADVEAALSARSADFKQAVEFRVWYAEYLKGLETAESK